jgi:probable F420-dependent oxidoreductase
VTSARESRATLKFGVVADIRNPPGPWNRPSGELYPEIIEHLAEVEALGFDAAWCIEHHFTGDDYMPSPLIVAAAIAARTKRMRIATNIAILPLYHPVRFAEDAALVDAISNGRLDVGVGLGWQPDEFAGYGIDLKERGRRADEILQIVQRLWRGEMVSFQGKYFQIDKAQITPRPVQTPTPPIWIAGLTRPGIRRAAKYGDGYTGLCDKASYEIYVEELRALGKDPALGRVSGALNGFIVVSDDPPRSLALYAPHVAYFINTYAKLFETSARSEEEFSDRRTAPIWSTSDTADELVKSGMLSVLRPEETIERIKGIVAQVPLETLALNFYPPGLPIREVHAHMELFARKVIPAFR